MHLSDRPSPGLNKKTTSHNTHKILMCLQNYLIFYLEVIPPLSSFIALYTSGVGSSAKWGQLGGGAEGVFTPDFGKTAGPRGPSHRPPRPTRLAPLGGCWSLPGSLLCCPARRGFHCVSE